MKFRKFLYLEASAKGLRLAEPEIKIKVKKTGKDSGVIQISETKPKQSDLIGKYDFKKNRRKK